MDLQQRINHRKLCYDKPSILLDPHVKTDNVEGENDPLTPTKNNDDDDGDIHEEDYLDVFTHSTWSSKFGSIAHSEHGDVIADNTPPSVGEVDLATGVVETDDEIVPTSIAETPFRKVKPQAIKPGKIQVL
jgi:hypothetical protein